MQGTKMDQNPLHKFPDRRALLTDGAEGLEIHIPVPRNGLILFCYTILLLGLGWGSLFASQTGHTVLALLLLAFFIRFAFNVLWILTGSEHVTLSRDDLVIRRKFLACEFASVQYKLTSVSNVHVEPFFRDLGFGMGNSLAHAGAVEFDCVSRKGRFGTGLDVNEAGEIVAKIQSRCAQRNSPGQAV